MLQGCERREISNVLGAGIEIRFDVSGGLPGNQELRLVELREDLSFDVLMEVEREEGAGQQHACCQRDSGQVSFHKGESTDISNLAVRNALVIHRDSPRTAEICHRPVFFQLPKPSAWPEGG